MSLLRVPLLSFLWKTFKLFFNNSNKALVNQLLNLYLSHYVNLPLSTMFLLITTIWLRIPLFSHLKHIPLLHLLFILQITLLCMFLHMSVFTIILQTIYHILKVFSSTCFVLLLLNEYTKSKPWARLCCFLGYGIEHKGYRCWDPISKRLWISRHVTF